MILHHYGDRSYPMVFDVIDDFGDVLQIEQSHSISGQACIYRMSALDDADLAANFYGAAMTEQIKDGGPAFPCQQDGWTRSDASGLTMRDYFAAKAMQGLCANAAYNSPFTKGSGE